MTTTQRRPSVGVNGAGVGTLLCAMGAMAMLLGGSPAMAATRDPGMKPHHVAVAKGAPAAQGAQARVVKGKTGLAAAKVRSAKTGAAGMARAGVQRPASGVMAGSRGRVVAQAAPQAKGAASARAAQAAKKRGRRQPEVDDRPVMMYRTGGHAARAASQAVSPAVKTAMLPAAPRARQAPMVAASAGAGTPVAPSDSPVAAGAAQSGVFASGQSRPEDDERLPPPGAVKRVAPMAIVQSNDPTDGPLQQATVRQQLSGSSEDAGEGVAAIGGDLETAGVGVPAPRSASAEVTVLRRPSHEELAEEAMQPVVLLGLYRNGRLVVPAPLKGTHEILVHQNLMADADGLERIRNDDELNRLRASHQLVELRESEALRVNPELAGNRRCARAWSARFAEDMARSFYARFRQPLQVNSAVRTVAFQIRLQRVNGNAAPVEGDVASPHLTGQALDFGKRGMSVEEIAWMRSYLLPLMQAGKVDVEEEFQQACFHISVYRAYLPSVPLKRRAVATEVAQLHSPHTAKTAGARVDDER